ncbi:MAG: VapC toxin family PIN domain ribonuclease, partial [Thermodesulfobacteriota bacterium]
MNLVDTSGWIEYFFEGNNASSFAEPIEDTINLTVPVVCLYEVFKKVNQVADEARALQAVAQMKQGQVIELSE